MDADSTAPLLRTVQLSAGYGELDILKGIELSMRAGEIVCVIGANGVGKSTLLKTIFGEVRITGGQVYLGADDVTAESSAKRLRRGIVLVPQGRCNFPTMTVRENLELGGYLLPRDEVEDHLQAVLDTFPILERKLPMLAGNMSGGEQQLLEMGMSLMLRPRLVLIDEPSLGLSHKMQALVFETLNALADRGIGVLLVEQNAVRALEASHRGLVVEQGRVSCEGSGVEMLEDKEVRRAYLGLEA